MGDPDWPALPFRFAERGLSRIARSASSCAKRIGRWRLAPQKLDAVVARNRELVGIHRGRRCFVIGNGPSLAGQDLSPLAGEITFVTGAFWKHPVVATWQPTYYVLADPVFFDGSEPSREFFAKLRERITASIFLVPAWPGHRGLAETEIAAERLRTIPIAATDLADGPPRRLDLVTPVPAVQNVAQLAIMAALAMGCSPIYLLGLDHDWLAHRGQDRHFYQGKTLDGHPVAHAELSRYSYRSQVESVLNLWRGYEHLDAAAAAAGGRIVNATAGGMLDVFERAEYASIIAKVT